MINIPVIFPLPRRQMVENLRKMQELRAQIQAQIRLAETLKKLSDNAGRNCIVYGNKNIYFGF